MKHGNKILLIFFILLPLKSINAEQKITSTPLINIEDIKPSFENIDDKNEISSSKKDFKEKKIHENYNHPKQFY